MMTPRQILSRGLLLGLLLAVLGSGAFLGFVHWYAQSGRLLPGTRVGQARVGGMRPADALRRLQGTEDGPGLVQAGLGGGGDQPGLQGADPVRETRLRWGDRLWSVPHREVGLDPDLDRALQQAVAIGRSGSLWQRGKQFLVGLIHGHYVPLEGALEEEALVEHLERVAQEVNRPAVDARYDLEQDAVTAEAPGQTLDLAASLEAVKKAMAVGRPEVELVVRPVPPAVRKADVPPVRRHQVARFTTPILAAEPGRVRNIALAVQKISGKVIRPGQVFSFNEAVGPRDAAHGWAQAKEIYQGEFVMGYGGGICQVSSTLYNSVLLAGLEVRERYHHERPLQYVDPGRDATVVWNVLDFKFRNNARVPLLLTARILPGSPQQIEVAFLSPAPLPASAIRLEEGDVRYHPPAMEEELDPTLPANQRKVVDEGHYGLEVKIYRVYGTGQQERRELISHDRYLPKPGRVRVGVGNAPGSDRLLNPGLR